MELSGHVVYCFYLNNGIVFYLNKKHPLKSLHSTSNVYSTKRTTFLALGVDILYLTMVMQPCSKDTFNNVTVTVK